MRLVLTLLIGLLCLSAQAAIYKKVLPDGTVIYTDQPESGGKEIELPEIQTIPPPKPIFTEPPSPSTDNSTEPATNYTSLTITSPGNDETIRANDGKVVVKIKTEPPLQTQQGHKILIKMDGNAVGGPATQQQYVLENVDRGTHTLQASIQNKDGDTLLQSPSVTFHIKRHSILFKDFPIRPSEPAPPANPTLPTPPNTTLPVNPALPGSPAFPTNRASGG